MPLVGIPILSYHKINLWSVKHTNEKQLQECAPRLTVPASIQRLPKGWDKTRAASFLPENEIFLVWNFGIFWYEKFWYENEIEWSFISELMAGRESENQSEINPPGELTRQNLCLLKSSGRGEFIRGTKNRFSNLPQDWTTVQWRQWGRGVNPSPGGEQHKSPAGIIRGVNNSWIRGIWALKIKKKTLLPSPRLLCISLLSPPELTLVTLPWYSRKSGCRIWEDKTSAL